MEISTYRHKIKRVIDILYTRSAPFAIEAKGILNHTLGINEQIKQIFMSIFAFIDPANSQIRFLTTSRRREIV